MHHTEIFISSQAALTAQVRSQSPVALDGKCLDLAGVVAVARFHLPSKVAEAASQILEESCNSLQKALEKGASIYGVNTGFGGSADVRTKEVDSLQKVLIRELHYGILGPDTRNGHSKLLEAAPNSISFNVAEESPEACSYLPSTWTRAAILIRINSLLKGYSAVRPVVVERMQDLLKHEIIPMVPLRGSISASGDLSPLSYIGGAIQGSSTVRILPSSPTGSSDTAEAALRLYNLAPVALGAKEGLAIVNGTAISAAAASLVLFDINSLAVLCQIITAMSVEALRGRKESFHPHFSDLRPHPGQVECAANIAHFLIGSKLTSEDPAADSALRQDRYSIRTAPQWIGPVLEDLSLAHQQVSIELNSATDNPLFDQSGHAFHGGNFQAKAITSAMEKARSACHTIGRMLFSQCTELINPATNRGLPPNLVIEDPSTSFIFKAVDLNIAALQSELGFLAAPVNHVMAAEMGNQALNSLALIAARYTHTAAEVLSQMAAAHIFALCQALDIRALNEQFWSQYRLKLDDVLWDIVGNREDQTGTLERVQSLSTLLWPVLQESFEKTVSSDKNVRFRIVAESTRAALCRDPSIAHAHSADPLATIDAVIGRIAGSLEETWTLSLEAYVAFGSAEHLLGIASMKVYKYVRSELGVPMLHTRKLRTPRGDAGDGRADGNPDAETVGSYKSRIFNAVRSGAMNQVIADALDGRDTKQEGV